jgi:hypothetical protein
MRLVYLTHYFIETTSLEMLNEDEQSAGGYGNPVLTFGRKLTWGIDFSLFFFL